MELTIFFSPKRILTGALLLLLAGGSAPILSAGGPRGKQPSSSGGPRGMQSPPPGGPRGNQPPSSTAPRSSSRDAIQRLKSMAEEQHEIVMALLREKRYRDASREANQIFNLGWPESEEPLLLKELLNLSDQFLRHGQTELSLQIIERNSHFFKRNSSRIEILKEQGYLYKDLGQDDRSLDCFQKARDLERYSQ
jgi:tetratricopeptide (TPR) repeat protein